MRRVLIIAVLSLFASPAQAGWSFLDESDDQGPIFKAAVLDVGGKVELQYYCDDWFPGMIDLNIYTGETFDQNSAYAADGIMTVSIDGEASIDATAFFDDFEGELLIFTSNFDIENLEDVLIAMATAQQSIGVGFYGRNYLFPAENVFDVLQQMAEKCPQ